MKYLFAVPLIAAVVLVASYPGRSVSAHAAPSPAVRTVSVVSLNMAKAADPELVLREWNAVPRLREADVLLLQEVAHRDGAESVAEEVARLLGWKAVFAPAGPGIYDQGLAIVSRYPISDLRLQKLKFCNLRFRCRTRFAMNVRVTTPYGDLRVWNAHLDTRVNAGERLEQLQPVIDAAAGQRGVRLIGGDFNTNDFYWIGNVAPVPAGPSHGAAIRRAMEQRGFRTPFSGAETTFPALRRHLDWIFLNGADIVDASVEPVRFSDHHAVWTRIRLPG